VFLTANLPSQVITMRIVTGTGTIELIGPGGTFSAGWTPQIEWVRLMLEAPGSLVGDYSIDGTHWSKLGTEQTNGTLSDTLRMEFGVRPGSSGGGSGAIDEHDECR